jgi:hypothetical protein
MESARPDKFLSNGGAERLGRFTLDQMFAPFRLGLGRDRARPGPEREEFANPSCLDANPLGDPLLGPFIRVHCRQDVLLHVNRVCRHAVYLAAKRTN